MAIGLTASPAIATPFPALTTAPAPQIPGKIVYAELVTPDLAAAERFYGGLFGWTFHEVPVQGTRYAEATLNGRNVAGVIERPMPAGSDHRPSWLTFVATNDVSATVARATSHGARVLFAPREEPGFGTEAVLADPGGGVFALLASASGDPPDTLAQNGEWIWNALLTNAPDNEAAFYQDVLGYDVYGDTPGHLILSSGGYARFAIAPLPASARTNRSRWIGFVRVADVQSAAGRATSLGGRVLVAPHTDRDGHTVAVLADPAGAVIGLLEWSDADGGTPP